MADEGVGADDNVQRRVGVLGASSLVGGCLIPLLTQAKWRVTAFSRHASGHITHNDGLTWRQLPLLVAPRASTELLKGDMTCIPYWVCAAPIWVLPDYFDWLEAHGAQRVVVVSSTSRFTKDGSSDQHEQAVALRLANAEARLQAWAQRCGIDYVILRPTLIYGLGQDKNISEIGRFIQRFGFFPVFGKALGLRQPVHAADVAAACLLVLQMPADTANRGYNISGGETLAYRTMVARIFTALDRPPRLLTVPLWLFRLAIAVVRLVPRYRQWSVAMAERMNRDLVFDHADAKRSFGFTPRPFVLTADDIPARKKQP